MSAHQPGRVLVLNASYEPLTFVSLKRAVVLLMKQKAEIIEEIVERQLRAERIHLPRPLVIRLIAYVPIRRGTKVPVTRRTLLARDNYTCQYCGTTDQPLTIDHVVPRARGGKTEWTNVVAACAACNRKKADKLPAQAGMPLRCKPAKPTYLAVVLLGQARYANREHQAVITRYLSGAA
jgi:5-methylcytosine-specific restriction endonuclease McrA